MDDMAITADIMGAGTIIPAITPTINRTDRITGTLITHVPITTPIDLTTGALTMVDGIITGRIIGRAQASISV
jgi:hypothetical protein